MRRRDGPRSDQGIDRDWWWWLTGELMLGKGRERRMRCWETTFYHWRGNTVKIKTGGGGKE